MVNSVAKLLFVRRECDVWAILQRHQAKHHVNEQLALKSAEVADLLSLCTELKDDVATERGKVPPLEEEVRRLRARVAPLQEEVWLLNGNLPAVAGEQDESRRQVTEASLRVDSLTRELEVERSEGQALRAWMGGNF
jgi:chromosome segregation ATPase